MNEEDLGESARQRHDAHSSPGDLPSPLRTARSAAVARLPMGLLLVFLATLCAPTVHTYLVSDDLKWVARTVADSRRPWNAFVEPLFEGYYRPVAHLVWLLNYYLWGFDFVGHHAMFLGMWIAIVGMVYAVGARMGGRPAGFIAATLVGLNDIYLLMASWKSWYTTLVEMLAVTAWAWLYLGWLETRRRRAAVGWGLLAVVALLSRELGPLIISACAFVTVVFPRFRGKDRQRAAWGGLALWAALTVAGLAVIPSYREAAASLFARAGGPTPPSSGVSTAYVADRLRSHLHSMLSFGLSPGLLLFAVLASVSGMAKVRGRLGAGRAATLSGAVVLGSLILALPWGARALGASPAADLLAGLRTPLHLILLAGFLAAAFAGDRHDRFLGAWFLAGFAPVLVLPRSSNAYHMLALVALALYTGKSCAAFVREEALPACAAWRDRRRRGEGDAARAVASLLLAAVLLSQCRMFLVGWEHVSKAPDGLAARIAYGRARRAEALGAVRGALADPAPDRQVWIAEEGYSLIAALQLQEEHGFTVRRIEAGSERVGLRTFDSPLRVYTDAILFSDRLFGRFNAFPNPGFESAQEGLPIGGGGRTGERALAWSRPAGAPKTPVTLSVDSSPFRLRPGQGYVFGGFVRAPAGGGAVGMALRGVESSYFRRAPPAAPGGTTEWTLAWECAAPPDEVGRLVFSPIRLDGFQGDEALADDVFLCPVGPLIAAAREGAP